MKAAARNGDLTVVEAVQQIFGLSQAPAAQKTEVSAPAPDDEPESVDNTTVDNTTSLEVARR